MSLLSQREGVRSADWWHEHWRGMPEYVQGDLTPHRTLEVRLRSPEDVARFEQLLGGPIYHGKWSWYPHQRYQRWRNLRYVGGPNPRYPVYIISKGRWGTRLTARALERAGVPYRIVVEPQEHKQYAAVIDPAKILVLPFSNLGQGSIPARNWVWEHAIAEGHARHWILDDNIWAFYRLNHNVKRVADTGAVFRAMEDFVERYENVPIAGTHYEFFIRRRQWAPPFFLNTRVYSCILIRNDLPFRWRGRYNEDTDLSLRVLKAGHCTVLFNAFLAKKEPTMRMKGGNTDELYRRDAEFDGRLEMAKSLYRQHPDVVSVTRKWGRWQHHVDYRPFEKNELRLKPDLVLPDGPDEYGMTLREIKP